MTALSEAEARHASIAKLQAVVGAMAGIAAAHAQHARGLLPAYAAYADTIAQGLAEAVAVAGSAPAGTRSAAAPRILVVFGAEHGFAGDFSGRLLDLAAPKAGDTLLVLGARAISAAEQRGLRAAWSGPAASQASAVPASARRAADALYEALAHDPMAATELVFARSSTDAPYVPVRRAILPIDIPGFAARLPARAPLTELPSAELLEAVVGEHIYAELAQAALLSFASENTARLANMQSARFNIDRKLDELASLERQLRQDEVTAEVQEVVSGSLASEGW